MKILSHRGYWKLPHEKNTGSAFERSFGLGFGTETDVRDLNGALVISHDMPVGGEILLESVLAKALAHKMQEPLTIALNIKSDGLANKVSEVLSFFPNLDCFVFDMSVPDMVAYLDTDVHVFSRMSEVEEVPVWLDRCDGVWLDGFYGEWFSTETILEIIKRGKRVCVVSSELHGREPLTLWEMIRSIKDENKLLLCTDVPEEAVKFFAN